MTFYPLHECLFCALDNSELSEQEKRMGYVASAILAQSSTGCPPGAAFRALSACESHMMTFLGMGRVLLPFHTGISNMTPEADRELTAVETVAKRVVRETFRARETVAEELAAAILGKVRMDGLER